MEQVGRTVLLAESSRKQMSFKSGFESRERESQFNTAGGIEFHVRGAAVLNDRLANDVRQNGTHSSGTDDDHTTSTKLRKQLTTTLIFSLNQFTWFFNYQNVV